MSTYWHGGAPGLQPGDIIEPTTGTAHLLDGCPTCEARRAGTPLAGDDNDPRLVYVTTERWYARLYAAGYPRGWLYRVEPLGSLTPSNDPLPSWGTPSARVVSVYERAVSMTPKQVRSFMRRVEREASRASKPDGQENKR